MSTWIEDASRLYAIDLSVSQVKQFDTYLQLLHEWNQKINLTAIREPQAIVYKHFLDSLSIVKGLKDGATPASIIDIGTGAGFPGIPLKILFPETRLTLADSVGKKISFCQTVIDALKLGDCQTLTARAEEIGQDPIHREAYTLVTARAVAQMPVLAEYTLPLAKPGGRVILQKGVSAHGEAESARPVFHKLGGDLKEIIQVEIPETDGNRYLVVVAKNAHTPLQYPRRTGVPAKNPLS